MSKQIDVTVPDSETLSSEKSKRFTVRFVNRHVYVCKFQRLFRVRSISLCLPPVNERKLSDRDYKLRRRGRQSVEKARIYDMSRLNVHRFSPYLWSENGGEDLCACKAVAIRFQIRV